MNPYHVGLLITLGGAPFAQTKQFGTKQVVGVFNGEEGGEMELNENDSGGEDGGVEYGVLVGEGDGDLETQGEGDGEVNGEVNGMEEDDELREGRVLFFIAMRMEEVLGVGDMGGDGGGVWVQQYEEGMKEIGDEDREELAE